MSSKNLNTAENFILRLKEVTGIKTDLELSKRLGYKSTGTISMWKKSNTPDINRVLNTFENINVGYLLSGVGPHFVEKKINHQDVPSLYHEVNELIDQYEFELSDSKLNQLNPADLLVLLKSSIKLIQAYINVSESNHSKRE